MLSIFLLLLTVSTFKEALYDTAEWATSVHAVADLGFGWGGGGGGRLLKYRPYTYCNYTPLIGASHVRACVLDHSVLQIFRNASTGCSDVPEIGISVVVYILAKT